MDEQQWHKYPEEKPSGYDDALPRYFLCAVEQTRAANRKATNVVILCYIQSEDKWYLFENDETPAYGDVLAWMELPEPPKFD